MAPVDWQFMTVMVECMGPMADTGYALETASIGSPYVLRLVLDLVDRLRAPYETADIYSGRDPAVAAADV